MKLRTCDACGEMVSPKATSCPKCGHPLKKKIGKVQGCFQVIFFLIFFGVFVAGFIWCNIQCDSIESSVDSSPSVYEPRPLAERQGTERAFNGYISNGLVTRYDTTLKEVFVDPASWHPMAYEWKQQVAWNAMLYMGDVTQGANRVTIRDAYSGEKLASCNSAMGFKTY